MKRSFSPALLSSSSSLDFISVAYLVSTKTFHLGTSYHFLFPLLPFFLFYFLFFFTKFQFRSQGIFYSQHTRGETRFFTSLPSCDTFPASPCVPHHWSFFRSLFFRCSYGDTFFVLVSESSEIARRQYHPPLDAPKTILSLRFLARYTTHSRIDGRERTRYEKLYRYMCRTHARERRYE